LKNGLSGIAANNLEGLSPNNFHTNNLVSNVKKVPEDDILYSEERMITHTYVRPENYTYEQLILNK